MIIPYVTIHLVLTDAKNVRMVIVLMDRDVTADVSILTNVRLEFINAIGMPDVKISKVLLLALAIPATLVWVTIGPMENVPTSMNVHYQLFIAMVENAMILKAVISVLVLK